MKQETVVEIGDAFRHRQAMGEAWGFMKSLQEKHGARAAFDAMAYVMGMCCRQSEEPERAMNWAAATMNFALKDRRTM